MRIVLPWLVILLALAGAAVEAAAPARPPVRTVAGRFEPVRTGLDDPRGIACHGGKLHARDCDRVMVQSDDALT